MMKAKIVLLFALPVTVFAAAQMSMPGMADHSKQGSSNSFSQLMERSMQTMNRGMMSAPMTGDVDHDFASMMMPHHQGAIDMAKAELLHGKDPVMRRLAQEILAEQQLEIDLMKRRLAQLKSPKKSVPVSVGSTQVKSGDRVYTGDQTSNTVSVIDPDQNKLLGVIRLGDPVPGALSPLYKGQLLVHGLGFSPDGKTLAVVSIGSNSVTFIETATNRVKGTLYVGRSPHEAFFTPDGKELWCAVRGEDYVSVIDPARMVEKRRIKTTNGPGMVLFSPNGKYAYVPSSFVPELCVIDAKTYKVIARKKQFSPFSPNLAVSRDGKEVWFTLKDTGKTQVMSALPPFDVFATLDTGPITNHVTTVDNANGHFAYVSVGGLNVVKVYQRGPKPTLVATIPTGDLPHGIWASPDGTKVYVGLENGGGVQAIDALTNKVVATMPAGQLPQALVYVPHAVPSGEGTDGLVPLGQAGEAAHLHLEGTESEGTAVINSLGLVDLIQLSATGLKPGEQYELRLVDSLEKPFGETTPLGKFAANPAGAGIVQSLGPIRKAVTGANESGDRRRYLVLVEVKTGETVMKQKI